MRITFVISNLSKRSGGPPNDIFFLGRELAAMGVGVQVLTNPTDDMIALSPGVEVTVLTGGWRTKIRQIRQALGSTDFVFIWGVWSALEGPLFRLLRPSSCRYAYKTLGMLETYIMARNRLKKAVARLLYLNHNLRQADAVLVDTPAERRRVEQLGLSTRIRLCRNGVDMPATPDVVRSRTVLYLGRIVPKKGLDILLEAWPALRQVHPDVKLLVAGEFGDLEYERLIRRKIAEHGLAACTTFVGQVSGVEKMRLLQGTGCFALPSHSEGFSNAVLESLAAGTPVFITPGCNFPEVDPDGLGAVLPRDPAIWSARLVDFFSGRFAGIKSSGEIQAHIRQHFSWRQSATVLLEIATAPSVPESVVS